MSNVFSFFVFVFCFADRNLTADERIFNYRLSRARRVIENAFGILRARWRIFGGPMECNIEKAEDITKACVALHNYLCVADSDRAEGTRYVDSALVDTDIALGEWRQIVHLDNNLAGVRNAAARATKAGLTVRNGFKDYFQTPAGRVELQDNVLQQGRRNRL